MADIAPVETPAVPTTASAPVTPPPLPGAVAKSEEKKPDAKPDEGERLSELAAQTKRVASERMKLAHESRKAREDLAKEREALAKQQGELESWRKEREDRRRNPAKYLAAEYGPDWYDKLSKVKLDGAPTPDLIASEVDDKVAFLEKRLRETEERFDKQLDDREKKAAAQAKSDYEAKALSYVKENAEKYPLIHAFEVAGNVTAVIEAHFHQTTTTDDSGEVVAGELLTPEQAAQLMEKHLEERLANADKAKAARASTAKTAIPDKRTDSSQRRSLSTDMNGTSRADRPPPTTDAERMRRAMAAIDALGTQPN